ncbi:P-loop containing nucleoside triphosphate hydrolase protein [Mortierella sp. GBAus27b]|nr:hypothetical protein BGX31_010579 [Mortierella sp. GBA43]KAI8353583.1 P-loop containing nucleoside triphosphate hydrolase protein [Mortierella sp. GBAus27b]
MSGILSLLTRTARLPSRTLLPLQRSSLLVTNGSCPLAISANTRASIIHQRPFSTSWTSFAKRTPRPKQRIVKEQKLRSAWSTAVSKQAASRPSTSDHATRAKARQWRILDENDVSMKETATRLGSRSGSGPGSRPGSGPGPRLGSGPVPRLGSGGLSSTSPARKRIPSTSISVTSMEKGSRNPQFEHAFPPGFSSAYVARSSRKGPPVKTGNSRRDKAAEAEYALVEAGAMRRRSGPSVRGFVPARFALKPITSDVRLSNGSKGMIENRRSRPTVNPGEFAQTQPQNAESVKEMLSKVANSRFETMGLHPDVERGLFDFLGKSVPTATTSSAETASTTASTISKIKPTEIQAMTIPSSIDPMKKSPYTLCAAETGSGKTLAYLVPVMHQLKRQEDNVIAKYQNEAIGGVDANDDEEADRKIRALATIRHYNQPRAVVLLPSRELVTQVASILKEFSHSVKLRTLAISHSWSRKSIMQRLASGPIDIVVATPASLLDYLSKNTQDVIREFDSRHDDEDRKFRGGSGNSYKARLSLDSLTHLVIDEADTMFDHGFGDEVTKIVKQAKSLNSTDPVKITVVSATLPKKISDTLDDTLPGILKITTPSLHKSLPGLHQTFLDLKPYFGNRLKAVLDILAKQQNVNKEGRRKENTLVFCNTKHSCELLHEQLKTNQVPGLLGVLHGEALNRDEVLEQFKNDDFIAPTPLAKVNDSTSTASQVGGRGGKVLISTDIASRGIDTTAVDHVVLYDFPVTIVDYLHRVGRTARAGRGGRATSLVGRKDRNLAERIMMGIRMGTVLS